VKLASLLAVFVLAAPSVGASPPEGAGNRVVRVRASEAVAPCVEAAAAKWPAAGRRVSVERGPFAAKRSDLFVGSAVEMTRAVESGAATEGSEVDLAQIPWVLSVPSGNPDRLSGLADLERSGHEVAILGGPEAYEARRALKAVLRAERIREVGDRKGLEASGVTLVPLSLASGHTVSVDVPPLLARAALAEGAPQKAAAKNFLEFLGSDAGRAAFAACGR
jgi:hypothetical protein